MMLVVRVVSYLRDFNECKVFPIRLIFITRNCYHMIHLQDITEKELFIQDANLIRCMIHDCFCDGNMDKDAFNRRLWDKFLNQTINLIERWGICKVPINIRIAVNEVKRNILHNITV